LNSSKFTASSLAGFLVDYGMFFLLSMATQGFGAYSVPVSNVGARFVSAAVNYTLNKKITFRHKGSAVRTGIQYFLLASGILAGNTVLVTWLVNGLLWNRFLAKIFTECVFFSVSYLVQKFVIFRRDAGKSR
jgi:putative flippase GtrA